MQPALWNWRRPESLARRVRAHLCNCTRCQPPRWCETNGFGNKTLSLIIERKATSEPKTLANKCTKTFWYFSATEPPEKALPSATVRAASSKHRKTQWTISETADLKSCLVEATSTFASNEPCYKGLSSREVARNRLHPHLRITYYAATAPAYAWRFSVFYFRSHSCYISGVYNVAQIEHACSINMQNVTAKGKSRRLVWIRLLSSCSSKSTPCCTPRHRIACGFVLLQPKAESRNLVPPPWNTQRQTVGKKGARLWTDLFGLRLKFI